MLVFNLDRRKSQNMYFLWLEESPVTWIGVIDVYFKIILGALSYYSSPLYSNVCSHTAFRKN